MEKFLIVKDALMNVRRFNLQGRNLQFKIKPIPAGEDPIGWVKGAVNDVIAKATESLSPQDQVAFSFCSKDFAQGDGWIRFRPAGETTKDDVWSMISSIYQSNSAGLNTETFCLGVTSVKMPKGSGSGRGKSYNTFEEECGMRRGIIAINNKDNLCLPRALVVALALVAKDPEATKVRRDIGKLQTRRAIELCHSASVNVPAEGAGVTELQRFQRYLKKYNIVVYNYNTKGRDVVFRGATDGPNLNLIYHKGHYNVITSLTAAFGCAYYCEECKTPYNTKSKHRCGGTCPACQQSPVCSTQYPMVRCDDCQRTFRGRECYDNHKRNIGVNSICQLISKCEKCFKIIRNDRNHTCGEIYCKICKAHVPSDHLCYMQPDTGKPKTDDTLFVFYDLETRQETQLEDGTLLHEPNLCVVANRCSWCIDENKLYFCQRCGFRLAVYKDEYVIRGFMTYILEARKKFKQMVVLAHNGQAYDHQFILNHILIKTDLKPELIMRGTKIISMVIENVKFIDSLNYFPMALSKLPKALGRIKKRLLSPPLQYNRQH